MTNDSTRREFMGLTIKDITIVRTMVGGHTAYEAQAGAAAAAVRRPCARSVQSREQSKERREVGEAGIPDRQCHTAGRPQNPPGQHWMAHHRQQPSDEH
jgi:hypothetical protein